MRTTLMDRVEQAVVKFPSRTVSVFSTPGLDFADILETIGTLRKSRQKISLVEEERFQMARALLEAVQEKDGTLRQAAEAAAAGVACAAALKTGRYADAAGHAAVALNGLEAVLRAVEQMKPATKTEEHPEPEEAA